MIKSKKQMYIVIGAFALVLTLFTTTYAFFNYTRTGSSNNIRVGRIFFESKNEETITLNNIFPIDPSNTTDMNDPTKVGTYSIDIKGDTDYVDGIEYLVSAVDANIYTTEGQLVPISLDITVTGLGTSNTNYFTARESKNANIYKKIVGDTLVGDQMLLVGYIKPNTTSGTAEGVDGSITIKTYLDKNKILISDTYDGTESDNMGTPNALADGKIVITTSEWNALQSSGVSFKVKVEANEGIWVVGTLEEIMKRDNIGIDIENGVDFSKTSKQDNTTGVYLRAGTENDNNSILYYRGAVQDNNVIFGNYCWKAVRTTDTGGVKLSYFGERRAIRVYNNAYILSDNDITYTDNNQFVYDTTAKQWKGSFSDEENYFVFNVNESGDYSINYDLVSKWDVAYVYKNNDDIYYFSGNHSGAIYLDNLTPSDEIKIEYYYYEDSDFSFNITKNVGNYKIEYDCNMADKSPTIGSNVYNYSDNTLSSVGYMYGVNYTSYDSGLLGNARYGSGFTWDGTKYSLIDDSVTVPNSTHHYSCNVTTTNGTCTQLLYIHYLDYNRYIYIKLQNGEDVSDAINKMQMNIYDSNAKYVIDQWYENNLINYGNKLEDTIWCNDRSLADGSNNGWNPNGGNLSEKYNFGARGRGNYAPDNSSVKNKPSLVCINKNDRFTVNNTNGNRALKYPIALLTADEVVLAGGLFGDTSQTNNNEYYLNSDSYTLWTMSPDRFYNLANVVNYHYSLYSSLPNSGYISPAISIKQGQLITKGTGTVTDPYVIE